MIAAPRVSIGGFVLVLCIQRAVFGGVAPEPQLPDLIVWASESRHYMYGGSVDASLVPGKTVYRFTGALPNIGAGPLEIREETDANGNQTVYQRFRDAAGTFVSETAIGTFPEAASLPPRHLFLPGIARYNIREVAPNDEVGEILTSWDKTSMAVVDSAKYGPPPANTPPTSVYNSVSAEILGISIGWADVYGQNLPGQWADLTGLADGEYWLEVVADPENRIAESNELNNTERIKINVIVPEPTLLVGDYNRDGVVNAADYTVWRDSLGDIVPMGDHADGNLSGKITMADYTLWKENYGDTLSPEGNGGISLPEPPGLLLLGTTLAAAILCRCANRSRRCP